MTSFTRRESNGIVVTAHAQSRAIQRGLAKTADEIVDLASKCISDGVDVFADPTLRELVNERMYKFNKLGTSAMYALNGIVFIFNEDRVVTVIPIAWLAIFDDRELVVD